MEHTKYHYPDWHIFGDLDEQSVRAGDPLRARARRLTGQSVILLLVLGLFSAANALSGTFVNVYIWKAKSDFTVIGWFALVQQLAMALTFVLAGKWVKEHNKMNCLRMGVAISAVFYLTVLLLQKQAVHYVWLLGCIQGAASGCFWLAFNVVYFEVTGPENRDKFNGWSGLIGSGAGILAPWVSGFLIARMTGGAGYRLIFFLSLVTFSIGVVVSFFLKKRKTPGAYRWLHAMSELPKEGSPWRLLVPAMFAQGTREGVFSFIIGLLVYISTKQELQLGNFTLITSSVAFFSFMLAGRWLKIKYRNAAMLTGTLMLSMVILPLFWKLNYFTLLVFGIGTSIFMPLYIIPMTSTAFDLIGRSKESARDRVEYIVLRELGLCSGRIFGILLFVAVISWTAKPLAMNFLLLGIGSSPVAAWFFMRKFLRVRKG